MTAGLDVFEARFPRVAVRRRRDHEQYFLQCDHCKYPQHVPVQGCLPLCQLCRTPLTIEWTEGRAESVPKPDSAETVN